MGDFSTPNQVRRRNLAKSLADLQAKGCGMQVRDHWLWPAIPDEADIVFRRHASGDYSLKRGTYTPRPLMSESDRLETVKSFRSELVDFGIREVHLLEVRTDPTSSGDYVVSLALEAFGL